MFYKMRLYKIADWALRQNNSLSQKQKISVRNVDLCLFQKISLNRYNQQQNYSST